ALSKSVCLKFVRSTRCSFSNNCFPGDLAAAFASLYFGYSLNTNHLPFSENCIEGDALPPVAYLLVESVLIFFKTISPSPSVLTSAYATQLPPAENCTLNGEKNLHDDTSCHDIGAGVFTFF